jgi:hypothetical protein
MPNRSLLFAAALALAVSPLPGAAQGALQTVPPQRPAQGTQPPSEEPPAAPPAAPQPATPSPSTPPAAPSPAQPPAATAPAPPPGGGRDCIDTSYDFSLSGPDEWKRATDTTSITVPGEVRCVWSPDGTTTLTVFVQKTHRPTNPRTLLTQSVSAIEKGLGATVPDQAVRDVGGMRAMWMIVNGKGTGAALTANGTVPTAQHWVAIPRAQDVIIFLLTAPQDKFADQDQTFQGALSSLKVGGTQTPEQKAAH